MIASTPGTCAQVLDQLRRHALGVAQQIAAGALPVLRDRAQHLLFQLRAHARQHAQLLLLAEPLQLVDRADAVMLENQRDALRTEPLDLEELQRAGRELLEQQIAPLAGAALHDLLPARPPGLCRCRECR